LISSSQDANGRLFLFAEPRVPDAAVETAIPAPSAARASPDILQAIETTALRYAGHGALRRAGLSVTDWALLYRANIEVESAYNPAARSPVGAIGLGQLMPDTARDLGVDPHDIAQNLDGSARYLLMMLDQFGEGSLALAAYNAGPEAVTRHGGIPPFRETQGHVARVTAVFERLRGDLS
jgi:soluble lytic murein transglycosylase-like protein